MRMINFRNSLDMLKYILDSSVINRDKFVIIVTGRVGPTGKTWLCQELRKLGYHASELSPMSDRAAFDYISVKDDGFNRMTIDEDNRLVVVVLNEILPMYRNKGFGKTFDEDEDIFTFSTLHDADQAFTQMVKIARNYGTVTRADFMSYVGVPVERDGAKRGWTYEMLKSAKIHRHTNGYFLEFPSSIYLG